VIARKWVLVAAGLLVVALGAAGQARLTPQVYVYATHFVADQMRFESIEELRTYLLDASNDFFSLRIQVCAAKDRVQELSRMMQEVIAARAARRNQSGMPYNFGVGSPPECPWTN
jgi:hypothetical protein